MSSARIYSLFLLQAFFILVFAFFTGNIFDTFTFLFATENPIRNIFIYVVIWILSLFSILSVLHFSSSYIKLVVSLFNSFIISALFIYHLVQQDTLDYSTFYSLFASRDDWLVAFNNYTKEILSGLTAGFLFLLLQICFSKEDSKSKSKSKSKEFFLVALYLSPFILSFNILSIKGGSAIQGFPSNSKFGGMLIAAINTEYSNDFDENRSTQSFSPNRQVDIQDIVVIVDESVRFDFIEYSKDSSLKQLWKNSSRIVDFGLSTSSSDCSNYSNLNIRFGTDINNIQNTSLYNKSIFYYAKNAGFKTTYIDSQRRFGQLQNFMSNNEYKLIDNFIQFNSVNAIEKDVNFIQKDFEAAKILKTLLSNNQRDFVFLNKEGVHAPYEGKYPEYFNSSMSNKLTIKALKNGNIEKYKNYNNAIVFNVDGFFSELFSNLSLEKSLIIYTSDHGQNLGEKKGGTHCSGENTIAEVFHVPLLLITDSVEKLQEYNKAAQLNKNKTSHFEIYPTVLKEMGYDFFDGGKIDNSLIALKNKERKAVIGDYFHNKPIYFYFKEH